MTTGSDIRPMDLTVIVPTFDRPGLIRETIASVLAQTVPAKAILVVDNGPFAREYSDMVASYGGRVTYVRNDPAGTLGARNAGLRRATTEWVAFLDDDDLWKPRFLELARAASSDPRVSYIGADHVKFEAGERQRASNFALAPAGYWDEIARPAAGRVHSFIGRFPVERLLRRIPFYPSSAIVKRELALAVGGFDLRMTGYVTEDIEFLIRVLTAAEVAIIWEPMMEYRLHPGSYSRGRGRQEIGRWKVFEFARAHHPTLDPALARALDEDLPARRRRVFDLAWGIGDYATMNQAGKLLAGGAWTPKRRLMAALAALPPPLAEAARHGVMRLTGRGDRLNEASQAGLPVARDRP